LKLEKAFQELYKSSGLDKIFQIYRENINIQELSFSNGTVNSKDISVSDFANISRELSLATDDTLHTDLAQGDVLLNICVEEDRKNRRSNG